MCHHHHHDRPLCVVHANILISESCIIVCWLIDVDFPMSFMNDCWPLLFVVRKGVTAG